MSTTKSQVDTLIQKAANAVDSGDAMRFSQAALNAANAAAGSAACSAVADDQIKRMAERFLNWKLPENFSPDGGISFERSRTHLESWPTGTNLIGYSEALAMVRHMVAA